MTDICETEMRVYGKRQDLEKFRSSIDSSSEDHVIDFNKIIPMPEDLSMWDKDKDGSGEYYWTREHWGVKGGDFGSFEFITDKEDHLGYLFTTAWDPPFPIYETLISTYPTLDFHIIAVQKYTFQTVDILSKRGKITKYITWSFENVYCGNNKIKPRSLKIDHVNGTREFINELPPEITSLS